ncbi:type III-A CRISPR-associated protein Cas10/Csm1 [Methanopyrus kandleri]|uniref:Predicted DNA-dependent DNA polymerase, component of a thermophile-specific DNA repair system n=1 Tax=Methanopyrus kandleri (strain AV19 / DSM 6324 / JCM 9639 / NBRC 100938) TaxID=190192 RepID=Q8TVS4_METKA|nr:HD domain-containing protein [Methanopyrus kandleri]AAM02527.1 Predicted DNA-dependent DNA polymerase, component of a thermophile-specific DNA repair system [Methanopyrus kandleri AV19]
MERVALAGLLHDVGKLPQRSGERGSHQKLGAELLKKAFGGREREDETLGLAVLAARYHHSDSLGDARPSDLEVPEDWGLELAVVALADTLASAERGNNELDREEPRGDHRGYWTLYNPWYRIWEAFRRRLGGEVPGGWGWTEGRPEFVPDELPLLHLNVDPREFEPPKVVEEGEGYRGRYRGLAGRLTEWLKGLGVRDHPHPFDPARVAMEVTTSLVPAQHYIPEGRDHMRSITLYDHSLLTASLASCLWYLVEEGHLDGPEDNPSEAYHRLRDGLREGRGSFLLVRGSLSGIGEFIRSVRRASPLEERRRTASYLKIIRGRSAFVDLLTAGAAWTVLRETLGRDAHPAFLLRAAGGSFTLLLPNTEEVREALEAVREGLKRSVSEGSDGVLSLGLAWVELDWDALMRRERFRERVEELGRRESEDRRRAVLPGRGTTSRVEEPCPVCGSPVPEDEGCEHCERLGDLGDSLVRRDEEDRPVFAGFLVYEDRDGSGDGGDVVHERDGHRYRVHHVTREGLGGAVSVGGLLLVDPAHVEEALKCARKAAKEGKSPARVVMSYFPWYAATKDDVPESEGEEGIATFSGMAERSPGASLLGFAYVDVDNLGEWVREAAGDAFGVLLSISRFTDLVFRHWVNALGFRTVAELLDDVPGLEVRLADGGRELDPPELLPRFGEDGEPEPEHGEDRGRPFLLVYSGGDDLLVAGAWNEAYSLPFEVFLLFSHVTGYLPVASLSGAVVLTRKKAPFHLVLRALKAREREAKRAGEGDDPVRVRLAPKGYVSLLRLSVSKSLNVKELESDSENQDTHPVPGPVRFDLALAAVDMLKDVVGALDRKARAYRLLRALRSWWGRGDVGAASALAYVVSRMEDDSGVDLSGTLLSVLPVKPPEDAELYPVGLFDVALIPHLIARRGG